MSSSLRLVGGSASAATVSAWSLLTICGGVFAGTNKANQDETLEAGHARFRDGRQIRRHCDAVERGDRQSAQGPALTCGRLDGHEVEHHVDAPGNEVVECRCRTAIGDMGHLDPGHALEQLAGEVRARCHVPADA